MQLLPGILMRVSLFLFHQKVFGFLTRKYKNTKRESLTVRLTQSVDKANLVK